MVDGAWEQVLTSGRGLAAWPQVEGSTAVLDAMGAPRGAQIGVQGAAGALRGAAALHKS